MVLLTIVALASRVFLGGVNVQGDLNGDVASGLPFKGCLSDAVVYLGGTVVTELSDDPKIVVEDLRAKGKLGFLSAHSRPAGVLVFVPRILKSP